MRGLLRYFQTAFLSESLLTILRSSLLSGGVVGLMATSGTWQYFANTLYAHDMQRSAAWVSTLDAGKQPVVVMVDDEGYEKFFSGQSPVSRERTLALLKTIAEHTERTTRIVVDIDVSPVAGQERWQAELDRLVLQQPERWILPAVKSVHAETADKLAQWRGELCARGVGFGLPYVPTEFGYPKITHQFQGGLADAGLQPRPPCVDPHLPYVQKPLPLQAAALQTGVILPFSGDLVLLGQMLEAAAPAVVVLGGAWGDTDVYATPFGDRYGVQIHAAALAGGMNEERLAPNAAELLVVWLFVSLISTILGYLSERITYLEGTQMASMAGHAFFREKGKPFLFIVLTFGMLMALSEVLAFAHVSTGLWISTSKVGTITLGTMLLTWDWGRAMPEQYRGFFHAWDEVVAKPVGRDVRSVLQSWRILCGCRAGWQENGEVLEVGRGKAAFEGVCALLSVLSQTALPVASIVYALVEPL